MSRSMKTLLLAAAVAAFPVTAVRADHDHDHDQGHEREHAEKKCGAPTEVCLRNMAEQLKTKGWVGIEMQEVDGKNRRIVTQVVPDSPAADAGFREGDVLVSFNGVSLEDDDKAAYAAVKKAMIPGNTLQVVVERAGQPTGLEVELGRIPDMLLAQWVGQHMLDAHTEPQEDNSKAARP